MSWRNYFRVVSGAWLSRKRVESELDEELRFHMEREAIQNKEYGMTDEEARRAAAKALGHSSSIKEECRDQRRIAPLDTLLNDVRYSIRALMKAPALAITIVASLALGVGANVAIFTILDALLLQQLPVEDPARLALFGSGNDIGISGGIPGRPPDMLSQPEWAEIHKNRSIFADACGVFSLPMTYYALMDDAQSKEPVHARIVTGNYFTVLGVKPAVGQVFTEDVDAPDDAHPQLVISHAYWVRRFGANAAAVGRSMRIGGRVYTIAGVAAREFFGTEVGEVPDAWFPFSMVKSLSPQFDFLKENLAHSLYVIARLQPGVTREQAQAGATIQLQQLLRSYQGDAITPKDADKIRKTVVLLTPASKGLSSLRSTFSLPLKVLMLVVGLVLLIACANVANLLLARAREREREMAVRLALGSSRARAVRQLLTESLLLSSLGGLAGVLVAIGGSKLLLQLAGSSEAVPLPLHPNWHVLAFALGVSMLTGILFGTAPAVRATSVDVNSGLRGGRASTTTRERRFAGRALVVVQIALSLVLLIAGGLFIGTFRNLSHVDAGFDRQNALLFSVNMSGISDQGARNRIYASVEGRVRQISGVSAAGWSMSTFGQGTMNLPFTVPSHPEIASRDKTIMVNITGPGYLSAAGIPLLAGRSLSVQDSATSPKVAVIGEKAARDIFGSTAAIGQSLRFKKGGNIAIVGIARDVKQYSLNEDARWTVYLPYTQSEAALDNLVVRAPASLATSLKRAIEDADRSLLVTEVASLGEMVDRSMHTEKLVAQLSGFFAALALLIAGIGLYGVLSYSVARRTSEIGVRMALGARRGVVMWLVLRETLLLILLGAAAGVPVALAAAATVKSMLFGLTPGDGVTITAAVATLAAIGILAGVLPARRASNMDPMTALRCE